MVILKKIWNRKILYGPRIPEVWSCDFWSRKPITGRTHQIRLQMGLLGHPIVGDVDYGPKEQPPQIFRPLLHAHSLEFISPFTNLPLKICASSTEDPRECARHLLQEKPLELYN